MGAKRKKRASEVMWAAWDIDRDEFEDLTFSKTRRDCHGIIINGAGANRNLHIVRVRITELPAKPPSRKKHKSRGKGTP